MSIFVRALQHSAAVLDPCSEQEAFLFPLFETVYRDQVLPSIKKGLSWSPIIPGIHAVKYLNKQGPHSNFNFLATYTVL